MADNEQTTLSDEPLVEMESDETWHAKIVRLCHSEGLPNLGLGYSLKIFGGQTDGPASTPQGFV